MRVMLYAGCTTVGVLRWVLLKVISIKSLADGTTWIFLKLYAILPITRTAQT